jgi:LacI family transcriptional regulator
MRAQDSIERRLGFDNVVHQSFPGLNVLPSLETHADAARTKRIVSRALEHNEDIVGIYVASSEARASVSCIGELTRPDHLVIVVHERTPFSTEALRTGRIDAVIAQNPGHAVRSAVRILRARCEGREPVQSQDQLRIEILLKDNL